MQLFVKRLVLFIDLERYYNLCYKTMIDTNNIKIENANIFRPMKNEEKLERLIVIF